MVLYCGGRVQTQKIVWCAGGGRAWCVFYVSQNKQHTNHALYVYVLYSHTLGMVEIVKLWGITVEEREREGGRLE